MVETRQMMLKANPKLRKCDKPSDLEKLEEGDVVMLASSNMARLMRGVYEGIIDGQDAFIRGEFDGEIHSWRCPRTKINYLDGALILDQHSIVVDKYPKDSPEYIIKKAILVLAGLDLKQ